jgi:hypothetical protein
VRQKEVSIRGQPDLDTPIAEIIVALEGQDAVFNKIEIMLGECDVVADRRSNACLQCSAGERVQMAIHIVTAVVPDLSVVMWGCSAAVEQISGVRVRIEGYQIVSRYS